MLSTEIAAHVRALQDKIKAGCEDAQAQIIAGLTEFEMASGVRSERLARIAERRVELDAEACAVEADFASAIIKASVRLREASKALAHPALPESDDGKVRRLR